jgi:hypothetical protein
MATAPNPIEPTVAVVVPCYDRPAPEMSQAFSDLLHYTQKSGLCNVFQGQNVRGVSGVHIVRNKLLTMLLRSEKPFTHVLSIDDDICPPPDALVRMLSHGKDIVGALCTLRSDPPVPNIRWWDEENKCMWPIYDHDEGKLIEVGGMGGGMLLISVRALEAVAEAYFTCAYEKEMYWMPKQRALWLERKRRKHFDETAECSWFRFLPTLAGDKENGEDISFSLMAWRYAKIKVYCDTSIQPKHMGAYGFSYEDYKHYKEEVKARGVAAD